MGNEMRLMAFAADITVDAPEPAADSKPHVFIHTMLPNAPGKDEAESSVANVPKNDKYAVELCLRVTLIGAYGPVALGSGK